MKTTPPSPATPSTEANQEKDITTQPSGLAKAATAVKKVAGDHPAGAVAGAAAGASAGAVAGLAAGPVGSLAGVVVGAVAGAAGGSGALNQHPYGPVAGTGTGPDNPTPASDNTDLSAIPEDSRAPELPSTRRKQAATTAQDKAD
ncbi:MAG: hypothetical protein V4739_06015 [Pseudomonadota bacterium]